MVSPAFAFLPLYIYPFNQSWDAVTTAIAANPTLQFQIVISPHLANIYPDANYVLGLSSLNLFPNVQTLGYIYTSWATRNISEVEEEVDAYAAWPNFLGGDIAVDGIFFDETPTAYTNDTSSYLNSITSYARTALGPNKVHIAFNPGLPVNKAFYDIADTINIFENTFAAFNLTTLDILDWDLLGRSTYAIHSFNGDEDDHVDLIRNLSDSNVGGFLVTTDEGYTRLSSYWPQFCSELADCDREDEDDDDGGSDDDGGGNGNDEDDGGDEDDGVDGDEGNNRANR